MTRAKSIIRTDLVIGVLFIVNVASLIGGHGVGSQFYRQIHKVSGILLLIGCLVHLELHWNWIRSVLFHPITSLVGRARTRRRIIIWLVCVFGLCGLTGVMNWLAPGSSSGHFPHNWSGLHYLSRFAMIILLTIHLELHWKWIMHTFLPLSTR